ncbi:MAG: carboxypeptidase regulatory-like domain-containing protein [Gemmatimonadota bacterium]
MRFRSFVLVALLALTARSVVAQVPDTIPRAPGATVSGVVRDSIARTPLAGAWVQLVAADSATRFARTVASDSLGRFTFADVPDGRYVLGFFHPLLDSLAVDLPPRDVLVSRHRSVRADLATPSPARLRVAICGSPDGAASVAGGVVGGVAREARDGKAAAGVTVIGEWLEITFRKGGIDRRRPRLVVTTGENGWFFLCNAPSGGTMFLSAGRGADSTDLIEVQVPKEGFARRELYLGFARSVVAVDTTSRADTLGIPTRHLRVGDGRLRGTVVTSEGSRPLAGAVVRIAGGPMTRANDQGEWMLVDAPTGTRVLEVRAVGYYPSRRAVDVVADAGPVRVALSMFTAMLDTVRVLAERMADGRNSGFAERRRTGMGQYLTAQDLVRRGAIDLSDVFRNLPGIRTELDDMGAVRITMRSAFGDYCSPAFYLNGLPMFILTAGELDNMAKPKNVRAIEIYNEATTPPQFQQAMSGCGAIVVWTK